MKASVVYDPDGDGGWRAACRRCGLRTVAFGSAAEAAAKAEHECRPPVEITDWAG